MLAKIMMMAMTTSNSTSVNPTIAAEIEDRPCLMAGSSVMANKFRKRCERDHMSSVSAVKATKKCDECD